MENQSKNNNKNYVIYLLLAGLLGAIGYIWYSKTEEKKTDKAQAENIAQKIKENTDLKTVYDESLMRLDSLSKINESLNGANLNKDATISSLKSTIENQLANIASLKSNGKSAVNETRDLERNIIALNKRIDELNAEMDKLKEENKVLTEENTTVKTNLQQTQTELTTAKTSLEQTQTEKKTLETTVDVGQTLIATNFRLSGIDEKRGKEKTTTTAKRVDKLRIDFDLEPNRITGTGKKELFVCITAPDGTPVTVEALGSGVFKTRDEEQKPFTNKLDIDYTQGERKNVNFDWKQNSDFQKGDYKVEVFQNGYKIGESKVTFKKGGLFG